MKKKKYYIETWGCQMNVHDSETMAGILSSQGYIESDRPDDADIMILNTCSIREKAEQKFFSELGKMKTLKKRNPGLKIAVAGCIAQQQGDALTRRASWVDYVIGTKNIHILKEIDHMSPGVIAISQGDPLPDMELPVIRKGRVRAWVTIMYGCDNFCAYCIVPYTRGRESSRDAGNIIGEVKRLAAEGFKEVALLGQNVNSYRSTVDFPGLLRKINEIPGIERIRFVTSHPKDLSHELIEVMSEAAKVCEHIHLPLQSGSTKVLGLMNRGYTYGEYRAKVDRLREKIPGIAITSDIIAGFPQESDEDHRATVKALEEIGFDGIFAFKFSPRPGTRASTMTGQVPEETRMKRLNEILALQDVITEKNNKALEGTLQEVLIAEEGGSRPDHLAGRTRTNKIVHIPLSEELKPGHRLIVRITIAHRHSLEGVPLK